MLLHISPPCPSVIFQRKEKWLQQADKVHTAVPVEGLVESPAFYGTRRLRACSVAGRCPERRFATLM